MVKGKLTVPIKVGGQIVLGNGVYVTTPIQEIVSESEKKKVVRTKNSTYTIDYV